MQFRRAVPPDAPQILALWEAAEAIPSVTDTLDDVCSVAARQDVAFILALADEQVIGSVIGAFDGWRGNIYRLAVHPAHRRQGIARSLVSAAEQSLVEQGARRMTAMVSKDHAWAVKFWEAVGYAEAQRMARYVRNVE